MSKRLKKIRAACLLASLGLCGPVHALWWGTYGSWDSQTRKDAADASMHALVDRFNIYGDFNWGNDGWVDVYYNAGVPTAQAGYYGSIEFGGTWPNERVAQHELNHWLGSGTYWNWANMFDNFGGWTGPNVSKLIAQFEGDGTRIYRSGVHFYGYGLNYDTEVTSDAVFMRNVALMYAMRQDMGNGNPNNAWSATNVTLAASDPAGYSAFNWFGGGWSNSNYQGWSDKFFPHSGAAYSTGAFSIRTPQGFPSWTFGGDSLTVNAGGQLLYNGWGTAGVVTIPQLTLDGGTIKHDQFSQDLFQLAGNITLASASTINAASGNIKILSPIGGGGSLTITGAYSTTLAGASTYSGGTTLPAGTLRVANNAALGTGSVILSGGTLSSDNNLGANFEPAITNPIAVSTASNIAGGVGTLFRVNGNISGSAPLRLSGVLNGSGLRLGGNNSAYSGTVTVVGANTRLGATTAGSAAAAWVVNGNLQTDLAGGGTFDLGSLSGSGTISGHAINASPAVSTLRVGALNTSATFTGRITNSAADDAGTGNSDGASNNVLALTKVGSGVLTLTGPNTYTGPTTISGGILRLSNPTPIAAATPIGSYTFNHVSGSTVLNDGSGGSAMNGTLNANGGTGTINASGGPSAGMGALVLNGDGTTVDINSPITDLGGSANWTVSAWIKTTQAGATILNKGDGANWNSGFSTFYLGDGSDIGSGGVPDAVRWGGGWLAGSSNVNDGRWHLLTYTNQAGTKLVYVDGIAELLSQNQFANADTGSKIRIGFSPPAQTDGNVMPAATLSGIGLYNTALSAAQVASIYRAVAGIAGSPLPTGTNVTIAAGATLDLNGVSQTIGSLSGAAGSAITLNADQLTVASSASSQFEGAISGTGSLIKSGAGTLTLAGSITYTGAATVNAGTLNLASDAGSPATATAAAQARVSVSITGPDTTITLDNSQDLANLSIPIANSGNQSLDLHTPSAPGTFNALRIYSADLAAAKSSLWAAIMNANSAGSANPTDGIFDSGRSAHSGSAVGIALVNDPHGDPYVQVRLTRIGDLNLDGSTTIADFIALASHFNQGGTWQEGDVNYDGQVTIADFIALASNFNTNYAGDSSPISGADQQILSAFGASPVPEPGPSLALLLATLLTRRKRFRVIPAPLAQT